MTNIEIAKLFREVAAAYSIKNEGKYRFQIIAYKKAADAIEGSTYQIKDLYKEDKLDEIPGVGFKWVIIADANNLTENPDLVSPGIELIIPNITE